MAIVQKIRCQVERILDHGERVYTVVLKPERLVPRFRPGQFLHLALDQYDPSGFWPESRVFSIASSPRQRDRLRLVYSVRGRFTARMEREIREGRFLWVKMPYGEFVIDNQTDVVLVAGGTGITAFTAFLEDLPPDFAKAVHLAYGARSRDLLIFRPRLGELAKTLSRLRVYYFIEKLQDMPAGEGLAGSSCEIPGRLSVEAIWHKISGPLKTTFYLSGPPAMVKTISQELIFSGIQKERIKIDAWE